MADILNKCARVLAFWSSLLMGLLVLLSLIAVPIVVYMSKDLPDYNQLLHYDPPSISRIYSSDMSVIAEIAIEHRIFKKVDEIPWLVKNAFIAAEDQNFYQHQGIDLLSIVRAFFTNIKNIGADRKAIGGSTITQQVVKNFLLTNEHSLKRKVKEAILAYRISQVYSKDRILELYLNQIYLGNSSYGVAMAALSYFNKDLQDLNVEEAALLAAMPKAPSILDQQKNQPRAKARRNWVIDRMLEEGFITKDIAIKAKASEIKVLNKQDRMISFDYYAESARLEAVDRFGYDRVYKEGLAIFTNLDLRLQKFADDALRNGLNTYDKKHGYRGPLTNIADINDSVRVQQVLNNFIDKHAVWVPAVVTKVIDQKAIVMFIDESEAELPIANLTWARKALKDAKLGPAIKSVKDVLKVGDVIFTNKNDSGITLEQIPEVNGAIVVMQPKTGKVLAMSGGYSFNYSKYNRALQAMRQPGSVFKPIVYLTALENGYLPNSMLLDEPITIELGQGQKAWTPKNYEHKYLGPITLRTALEKSKNMPTVRLIASLGTKKVAETATRLGIYKKSPPLHYSMALGAVETTPLALANMYTIFASNGMMITPKLVDRIEDKSGKLLFSNDDVVCNNCIQDASNDLVDIDVEPKIAFRSYYAVEPEKNYQLVSILQGVVQNGTAQRAKAINKTIAAKTGTSNKSMDVWTIGFTKDLVCAVFVGFDSPKTLGQKEQGASLALPIFIDFMKNAVANLPDKPFDTPYNIHLVNVDVKTGNITTYEQDKNGNKNTANNIVVEALTKEEYQDLINNGQLQNNDQHQMLPLKDINSASSDSIMQQYLEGDLD